MADNDDPGTSWSDIPGRGFQPPGDYSDQPQAPGAPAYSAPPIYPSAPPPRRRSPVAIVLIGLGVLATLGGAVFAATQIVGDEGSPEKAVERLFEAVTDEDVLGVLEALPPSERDAFKEPVEDIVTEAKRLELLSNDIDLHKLTGIDLEVQNMKLKSEPLADGFATVTIEGGTFNSSTDPAKLPLGDFVKDVAGEELTNAEPSSDSEPATGEDKLVTIKEDGKWYVSLWYSLAEAGRRDSGAAVPNFGKGLTPEGADTPEKAVEDLIRAGAQLDIRRVFQLLPPDEARALHDYAPLFIDDAEEGASEAREFFQITIGALTLEPETDGDTSKVRVREFAFDAVAGDPADDERFSVSYKDGCATFAVPGEEERKICNQDFTTGGTELFGAFGFPFPFADVEPPKLNIGQPDAGFITVKRDGKWYVSPIRTTLEGLVATMKVYDRAALDELRRYFEELGQSFEEEFAYEGEDEGVDGSFYTDEEDSESSGDATGGAD